MRAVIYTICLVFLFSCSRDNDNENCRFLLNVGVNEVLNLSLPQYNQLQFAGNSVYVPNAGNAGIIVASTGVDFFAWDAGDPNHAQSACSVLENSGLEATCGCEDQNTYSLVTGQALGETALPCALKNYRVEVSGNTLLVTN